MSLLADLETEPWAHDLLLVLRRAERSHPDKPRIGDASARREEFVLLGEDPYLDFPASTIARADVDAAGRLRLFVKFLGLLGPQGALPLATTSEAYGWSLAHDEAFPRFLDILNHRFLQLFYRAWADSRPIAQNERPDLDRFYAYIGSAIGIGSEPFRDLDTVPDAAKLGFAGLLGAKAKSGSRLRGAIAGFFGVEADIVPFTGTYLAFEPEDRTRLGQAFASLGRDCLVGSSVYSVEDKFRVVIETESLAAYERFLPSGDRCAPLADLVFFHVGHELDWDLELALPASEAEPVRLGRSGRLGYTSWMGREPGSAPAALRRDARFSPAERVARARAAST